jgi:nitrite reductase/ring-hydroxylating ferredoxin subunit
LEKGKLLLNTVRCPYHYSRFSVEDGSVQEGPSTAPVPAYETQVVDGKVQVKVRK